MAPGSPLHHVGSSGRSLILYPSLAWGVAGLTWSVRIDASAPGNLFRVSWVSLESDPDIGEVLRRDNQRPRTSGLPFSRHVYPKVGRRDWASQTIPNPDDAVVLDGRPVRLRPVPLASGHVGRTRLVCASSLRAPLSVCRGEWTWEVLSQRPPPTPRPGSGLAKRNPKSHSITLSPYPFLLGLSVPRRLRRPRCYFYPINGSLSRSSYSRYFVGRGSLFRLHKVDFYRGNPPFILPSTKRDPPNTTPTKSTPNPSRKTTFGGWGSCLETLYPFEPEDTRLSRTLLETMSTKVCAS